MIPVALNSDGVMTYRMTGWFAEVFDNLQVCCKMLLWKQQIMRIGQNKIYVEV